MTSDFPAPKIIVRNSDYIANYSTDGHRRDICLIQKDRTLAFRRITAFAPDGDNEALTVNTGGLDGALELTTNKICFLRMCRLLASEIELAWHTSDVVRVRFQFHELLNETP